MDDLNELSFEELMKKMNEVQQIEINWKENKNPSQLRQAIKNINIEELNYLEKNIDDPVALASVVKLYFYKFFAIINMRVKDLIMNYKDDPSKLLEIQNDLQKIFNIDLANIREQLGGMDLTDLDNEEEPSKEQEPKNKRKLN